MNNSKQLKLGAIMSYFTIAFNMIAGLIYTPWMIEQIGQSNYGLYTLATSLITLFVMDFGMSAAVTRFLSKYRAEGNQQAINNFLGIVYKLYLLIDAFILLALIIVSFFINRVYDNLTPDELDTFKVLYVVVGLFSVISFPFTNLNGILNSHERFIEIKLSDLFHKVFIIISMVISLLMGYGVYALVIVNAVSGLLTILIKLIVVRRNTKARVNFRYSDKKLFKEIFSFSAWTTISSIAHRLIFNITPSIITAVSKTGTVGVAVFGLAQTIEGYIYTFATAINGMFMPRISKILHENKKDTDLMELMIRVGRLQCMIIGVLVAGFISFGKSFIVDIWNKPDFQDSYICAVLIIVPSFFFLPFQIANTTLIVENKVRLNAYISLIVGVINVILSTILSRYYGAFGASLSICIAYMVRNILNIIVYKKVLNLDVLKFIKATYFKITPFLLVSMAIGLGLEHFNPIPSPVIRFFVNGVAFVAVFALLMVVFVMNKYEKNLIFGTIKKIFKKLKLVK